MKKKTKHLWLYVLRLEQSKWYVGITSKTPQKRFEEHKNGYMAANWTRKYKPIRIHDTKDLGECDIERAQTYEGRVTREYMEKYGDNNVRGGDLTDVEDYSRHFGRIFIKRDFNESILMLLGALVIIWLVLDKMSVL